MKYALGLAALALFALAHAEPALADPPAGDARFRAERRIAQREAAVDVDRQLRVGRWKAAFALLGLGLAIQGAVLASRGRTLSPRAQRLRNASLAVLALLALASYYRFSLTDRVPEDMHAREVFHYYIGAKYFPELGYGGIYDCTLAVADQQRWPWVAQLDLARDLRTMEPQPAVDLARRGTRECEARFSPERWAEFTRDLAWLDKNLDGPTWRAVLLDHGYNPSPVWTLLALPVARFAPAESLLVLVHLDTLLVLGAMAALGWAFGFEALCLAAIAWGTGFLWRYAWIGDAFLRELWFATAVIGVCCLRRRLEFTAGALLATSALIRLFPAIFIAGYGLWALIRAVRERRIETPTLRFASGVAVASVVLIGTSLVVTGQGATAYQEFQRNTRVYRAIVARNMAGVPALLWRLDGTADLHWKRLPRDEGDAPLLSRRASPFVHAATAAAFLMLFALAVRRAEAWEATAAAFALIPILAAPPGYYFQFVVLAAVLATRRPWIAVWLGLACCTWLVNGLHWRPRDEQYTVASLVAVGLSLAVLVSMLRPPSSRRPPAAFDP
jgi:hypothetical protein